MKAKMTPSVRAYLQAITSLGGKSRAKKYPAKQLSKWAKRGGRPRALTPEKALRLARLEKRGLTRREMAEQLGVSQSTVVRALAGKRNHA